jgi:hypothetical protein
MFCNAFDCDIRAMVDVQMWIGRVFCAAAVVLLATVSGMPGLLPFFEVRRFWE